MINPFYKVLSIQVYTHTDKKDTQRSVSVALLPVSIELPIEHMALKARSKIIIDFSRSSG
jgi:hypothetical protein